MSVEIHIMITNKKNDKPLFSKLILIKQTVKNEKIKKKYPKIL